MIPSLLILGLCIVVILCMNSIAFFGRVILVVTIVGVLGLITNHNITTMIAIVGATVAVAWLRRELKNL
jgi:hypothetical protein